jgi:CHAT domain-containing protein
VPNPKDERLLDAATEISAVTGRLRAPAYEVRTLEDASFEAMASVLTTWPPNVVHYIGHAGLSHGEGNLILNGPDGRSRWVGAAELSRLLPSCVRLVCLSTCVTTLNYQISGLSRFGRTQGLVELPTTLANQFPVERTAVRAFWDAFYDALVEHGGNATEAVHQARVATARAGDGGFSDWSSFTLAVRDQTGVPFTIGRTTADPDRRRSAELKAQFATQLANDLAAQVAALGEAAPSGLLEQFRTEQSRAAGLVDELAEEG